LLSGFVIARGRERLATTPLRMRFGPMQKRIGVTGLAAFACAGRLDIDRGKNHGDATADQIVRQRRQPLRWGAVRAEAGGACRQVRGLRNVAPVTFPPQAGDKAVFDRVATGYKDDRNRRCDLFRY
jgi:hypothetical protein